MAVVEGIEHRLGRGATSKTVPLATLLYRQERLAVIGLEHQQVISAPLQDPVGNRLLTAHGIQRHDAVRQGQRLEQRRDRGDLVRLAIDLTLAERQALLAGPGADQVQWPLGPAAVEGPAHGLAVNRHDLPLEGLGKGLSPGAEAGLEGIWVDQHEDPPEGVVRGNAVGQGQKGLQPAHLVAAVERDVVPALRARDHRTHRNDQDVDQPMFDLARTPRILKRRKVLDQLLNRHRCPPFVDEGITGTAHQTVRADLTFSCVAPGAWAQSCAEAFDREVVAIDGKTLRRSFDRGRAQGPLHLVSAWASEQGLALGQREVDGKSNEITAIPALLETLSLKNCIVTLDAMGCQKTIANQILERGADYLLVLKANHGKAFLAVKECCERHCFARGATARPVFDAFDDSHGRLVRRRVFVCPEAAALKALDAWSGLRTVLAVETIRGVTGSGKVEAEIRYFLSSCGDDPTVLIQAIRRHWTIENGLHWVLDVTFREDDSRVRDRTAARNLAILRKVAINLMGRDRTPRISMRARRKQAAWNDDYMLALLAG